MQAVVVVVGIAADGSLVVVDSAGTVGIVPAGMRFRAVAFEEYLAPTL